MKDNSINRKKQKSKKIVIRKALSLMILLSATLLSLFMLSSCECSHEWLEATCTEPQVCEKCGETQGEALGHSWLEATCTEPKHCERCGEEQGEPLGHTPDEWVVVTPATCTDPGEQESTCSVCGENISEEIAALNPSGHTLTGTTVSKAATCTEPGEQQGVCSVCNQTVTEEIPASGHNFVDDEIITFASVGANGTKRQKCTKCGQTLEISFELTPQEEANISLVKNGTLNSYPNETINTAFSTYFANTQWAADGNLVIFGGDCTWMGEPAKAVIAFEVTDSSFVISQIEIDDNIFTNLLDISSIIDAVYSG